MRTPAPDRQPNEVAAAPGPVEPLTVIVRASRQRARHPAESLDDHGAVATIREGGMRAEHQEPIEPPGELPTVCRPGQARRDDTVAYQSVGQKDERIAGRAYPEHQLVVAAHANTRIPGTDSREHLSPDHYLRGGMNEIVRQ